MARLCEVCQSEYRAEIDVALAVRHISVARISNKFGLKRSNVWRHAANHLGAEFSERQELREMANGLDVLERLANLDRLNLQLLSDAVANRDRRDAALLIRANIDVLLAYAKLQGKTTTPAAVDAAPVQPPPLSEEGFREMLRALIESGAAIEPDERKEPELPQHEIAESRQLPQGRAYGV